MCLAIPMKVISIEDYEGIVELGGLRRKVNLQLLAKVGVGDYVIVHAGFAIQKLDVKKAEETLSFLRRMKDFVT